MFKVYRYTTYKENNQLKVKPNKVESNQVVCGKIKTGEALNMSEANSFRDFSD